MIEIKSTQPATAGRATGAQGHPQAPEIGPVAAEGAPSEVISPDLVGDVYGLDCVVYPDPVSGTPVAAPR